MNIIRSVAVLAVGGMALAGCGQQAGSSPGTSQVVESTTTMAPPTTTTTMAPTTTTTVCVPADTTAQRRYLDTVQASIRQIEGAITQIQLVIDNGIRDRDSARRYQVSVQADYNNAAAAFDILGTDTAQDKMTRQSDRLADAKNLVASWDATIAKARGDLTRAQAQKTDYERTVRETNAQITAAPSCS